MRAFFARVRSFFARKPRTAYYTTDGGKLAPYPDMTDSDLRDFEDCFNIPRKRQGDRT